MATLHLICPFLGAYLYSFFGGIREIITFDLLTYFLGIGLLSQMFFKQEAREKKTQLSSKILKMALASANSRPDIIGILVNTAAAALAVGVLIPLILPFVIDNLGGNETDYGLMMSLFGVGGILGGLLPYHF